MPSHGLFLLAAFILSLLLNLIYIIGTSALSISIFSIIRFLAGLDLILLLLIFKKWKDVKTKLFELRSSKQEWLLYSLCVVMFYLMMRNGGLIDILADGWWHMSLAERILEDGTVFSNAQHLTGMPKSLLKIEYPFLWHATLAIISRVSNMPLPVIWHAVAAFLVPLNLIGFYYFSFAVTRNHSQALGSVLLFCLIYGGLNSYFRVSPWPGNVSYIGLYACYYLFFSGLYLNGANQKNSTVGSRAFWAAISCTAIVIAALHGVALVLFVTSIAMYLYGMIVYSITVPDRRTTDLLATLQVLFLVLVLGFILAYLLFPSHLHKALEHIGSISISFSAFLLTPIIFYLLSNRIENQAKYKIGAVVALICAFGLAYSIDLEHLRLLFYPEAIIHPEIPRSAGSGEPPMFLPNWSHQLKAALLFSGLFSVPVALLLVLTRRDRASVFVASNAVFSFLALTSPEMFGVVNSAIHTTSAYRVHMLIFSPLIFSMALYSLLQNIVRKKVD
ncbi:MAG: hypothetical protein DSZ32_05670 [Gammaproteobacteria bacterium]|nr:MAG: hypothetical protein DSZ32_05670 [Gammaproteobacteria bacterium]